MLRRASHLEDTGALLEGYKADLREAIQEQLLAPLCVAVETDLRFHIHSHMDLAEKSVQKGAGDIAAGMSRFVNLPPMRFFNETLDIRAHVEAYLDSTFYNLTTVALYDWKTYSEMRSLVERTYGLRLVEAHLPGQTLDQGLDVLEIMRNIHIFVSNYDYNLNQQFFVGKLSSAPDNKHIETISIKHIANSVRQHGIGIANTTVNFVYQFLRQKITIVSKFLYDSHIKSRLLKDIRFFKDYESGAPTAGSAAAVVAEADARMAKQGTARGAAPKPQAKAYPYERAATFNREIRKLGVSGDNMSHLDQFRILLTEIGNALGYVRLVRSGGLRHIGESIAYVPDLRDTNSFAEMAEEELMSAEAIRASRILDETVQSMQANFGGGSNKNSGSGTRYFALLVSVFARIYQENKENQYMRNFYAIVPPLTINFVEHIIRSQDQLAKRQFKALSPGFTDDGFVMGVAYMLRVLGVDDKFDSLQWFRAVRRHLLREKSVAEKGLAEMGNSRKVQQSQAYGALKLKLSINKEVREVFEELEFSLHSARVFFQHD